MNKTERGYSAHDAYQDRLSIQSYEEDRFSSWIGRYRWQREQSAVRSIIDELPEDITVADCPCGTGRWWDALSERASKILAVDVSRQMLEFAKKRSESSSLDVDIQWGDAEALPFPDGCVDYVFSHALTKHLPIPVQYRVLAEFSRISRRGVVCSFGILTHLSYEVWRRRHIEESYPVFLEELEWMAESAGLVIQKKRKCTTPVGVEHTVLFGKLPEK